MTSVRATDGRGAVRKLVLITPEASTRRMLDAPANALGGIRFTPDGSIAYVERKDRTDNIYIQPPDGSAPRLIMSSDDGLGQFKWSPDRSKIVVTRQRVDSDVVLLRDTAVQRR